MVRYVAGRLTHGAGIVFLVATLSFVLIRVAPGDPFTRMWEASSASPELVARARHKLGLDLPVHRQYFTYLGNLAKGDWGLSYSEHRPVWDAMRERIPATVVLALAALTIEFILGITIGALQGTYPGSRTDDALTATTLTLYSLPVFWLGLMLLLVFGQGLAILPVSGVTTTAVYDHLPPLGKLWDRAQHLFLPAVTLGLVGAAGIARYERAAMLDCVRQEFIRTARAKGLTERTVLLRHALRNALLPIITLFGLSFPILLSGTVLVESVFAWPGLGKFVVDSIARRDYNVVTSAAVVAAVMVVVGNLLADVLYRVVDPRTRGEQA
ncbi:MAG: ABC transporter permease [Gemmatimonadales bacterium]